MFKNSMSKFMKYLLIYVAVVLSLFTVFLPDLKAGGLDPLPSLQKAIKNVRSLYMNESLSVLADKEYQVQKFYYQIQSKKQKLDTLNEVSGHFEKAATKAEEKFESGDEEVSQSAITKLKLGLAGTLNDIIELESEVKLARLSLASIFKDNSLLDRDMLSYEINPVEFKFVNFDKWFKLSGLVSNADTKGAQFSENEVALRMGFIEAVATREKLNLSKVNRKISRALLVSEVANYDFGIGDAGVLFEALIIYTRVLGGYYDSVYNFNLAVAELNRAKSSWIGNP
jgi:hypothetical protein